MNSYNETVSIALAYLVDHPWLAGLLYVLGCGAGFWYLVRGNHNIHYTVSYVYAVCFLLTWPVWFWMVVAIFPALLAITVLLALVYYLTRWLRAERARYHDKLYLSQTSRLYDPQKHNFLRAVRAQLSQLGYPLHVYHEQQEHIEHDYRAGLTVEEAVRTCVDVDEYEEGCFPTDLLPTHT